MQIDLAGAFVGAGQQAADHDAGCAGGERLGEIAGLLDAAVGDDRNVSRLSRPSRHPSQQ